MMISITHDCEAMRCLEKQVCITLLCQQVFDVTKAHVESIIDPDCIANDAGMKTMSFVDTHDQIISTSELTCQYKINYALAISGGNFPPGNARRILFNHVLPNWRHIDALL